MYNKIIPLSDKISAKNTNEAFVFIKPHAFGNKEIFEMILRKFNQNGIKIIDGGIINGDYVKKHNIGYYHYIDNSEMAYIKNPAKINLTEDALNKFEASFNQEWQTAINNKLVYSSEEFIKETGISPTDLNSLWLKLGCEKLQNGVRVAYSPEHNKYIINGFVQNLLQDLINPSARMKYFIVRFDKNILSWKDFRSQIIGETNPVDAAISAPNSIRGMLYNLGYDVDYKNNGIHASASPFEALYEQLLWIKGFKMSDSLLGKELIDKGLNRKSFIANYILRNWYAKKHFVEFRRKNPVVKFEGKEDKIVDMAEDKNIDIIRNMLSFTLINRNDG